MTNEERIILENAKVSYLEFIEEVKPMDITKAISYLVMKNAQQGLCTFLNDNGLHPYTYKFILDEMERIKRVNDYRCSGYPKYAANKEELIEHLQYRVDLINQILEL